MFKKLKQSVTTGTDLFLSILCVGFGLSVFAPSCNNGGNKTPAEDTTKSSIVSDSTTTLGQGARINWLQDIPRNRWDSIHFTSNPDDSAQIENEKRSILSYLWAHLAAYNARIKALKSDTDQYVVDSFYFRRKPGAPLRYTVKAFLTPEVRPAHHDGGGHLIPSEPDPPGGSQ